jgi:hypothetical protein
MATEEVLRTVFNHQHQRQEHEREHQHHGAGFSGPYWKRIHRGWRFWMVMLLMLVRWPLICFRMMRFFTLAGAPQQSVSALGGS